MKARRDEAWRRMDEARRIARAAGECLVWQDRLASGGWKLKVMWWRWEQHDGKSSPLVVARRRRQRKAAVAAMRRLADCQRDCTGYGDVAFHFTPRGRR